MRRSAFLAFALQILLFGCVILMISWVRLPWLSVAATGISGLIACGTNVAALRGNQTGRRWPLVVVWTCTLLAPVGLVLSSKDVTLDLYFVEVAWLMAATIFATSFPIADAEFRRRWWRISLIWGIFGSLAWLSFGYSQNAPAAFYAGLGFNVAFLIASKFVFRIPTVAVLVVNTLILLAFILPIGDLILRPSYPMEADPDVAKRHYSYSAAKKDPAAFERWWEYLGEQWQLLGKKLYVPDPSGFAPFLLRPGAEYVFFQSRIAINRKGFRGKEIADDKGTAYRIVALGESTTFGVTLRAEDRPWQPGPIGSRLR